MKLIIYDPNSRSRIEERFKVIWKISMKKKLTLFWIFRPVTGLFLILLALFTKPYSTASMSGKTIYLNLNLFLALGIALLFYGLIDLVGIIRVKKSMRLNHLKKADKIITFEIDDELVKCYRGKNARIVEWESITSYHEEGDFLFFRIDDSLLTLLPLDKRLLNQEERMVLKQLLDSKKLRSL